MSKHVKATVIAHSRSIVTHKEIITFELEFPRIILAEWNTHNMLSKNASSSRAIPVATMLKQVRENPAMPARFGKKNSGMQDAGEHNGLVVFNATDEDGNQLVLPPEEAWAHCARVTADLAQAWDEAGYAKQICNRWIETAQMMKVVMTATDLENFYWLRHHFMADPTIEALAAEMRRVHRESKPCTLEPGDWHMPYYQDGTWIRMMEETSLEDALTISASCCAQVSYRKLDDTLVKAKGVVARLNLNGEEPDQPVHASPLEHQAMVAKPTNTVTGVNTMIPCTWQEGITHMDRDGTLCSGNLKGGWIQNRQLVPNHVRRG